MCAQEVHTRIVSHFPKHQILKKKRHFLFWCEKKCDAHSRKMAIKIISFHINGSSMLERMMCKTTAISTVATTVYKL